ncbi:Anterior fat body protein [Penicillium atrosanguineum]|uniref:Anterior fat body protein n=1 Tax=Penicillium atrosanguineum TaxID=1132637 RepID=UPI002394C1D6|nr:Anterior fat body protein [Penicillium atrosanguineum]KAJ5292273.1 Anterior fat body protein [Penicillium atrosanguineum]
MLNTPFCGDMVFPSGALILSNSIYRHHQGLERCGHDPEILHFSQAWVCRYGGTHVNDVGSNFLPGYRSVLYMGIGLAGLGLVIFTAFIFASWRNYRADRNMEQINRHWGNI